MRLRTSLVKYAAIGFVVTILVGSTPASATLNFPFTRDEICNLVEEPEQPKAMYRLHSLCNVWYAGNPVPTLGVLKNFANTPWSQACSIIDELKYGATGTDRGLFVSGFGGPAGIDDSRYRNALCFYALLDQDADGIRDFRITTKGRFVENDSDVDDDGVKNLLDPDPFGNDDRNPVALPGWLQFDCAAAPESCRIQRELYRDYRIALANRDFDMTRAYFRKSVQTVDDTIRLVYGDAIRNHPNYDEDKNRLPSLQSVWFDNCDTINRTPWSSKPKCRQSIWETEATASAHNQSFTVHAVGAERPDFVRLGIFVHEFAHSWTFALDYVDDASAKWLLKKNFWVVPEFERELKDFGWSIAQQRTSNVMPRLAERGLLLGNSGDIVEHNEGAYSLNGEPLAAMKKRADRATLSNAEAKKNDLIGVYAYQGPWEWYADAFMAYVFTRMEQHVGEHSSRRQSRKIRQLFRAHVLNQWRGKFYHPNLSKRVFNKIKAKVPIDNEALDQLVCRYIVNSDYSIFSEPGPFGRHLVESIKKPDEIGVRMKEDWASVCPRTQS